MEEIVLEPMSVKTCWKQYNECAQNIRRLPIKRKTTAQDNGHHKLTLPVQRQGKQTSIIKLSTPQLEYPGATTVSTLIPW